MKHTLFFFSLLVLTSACKAQVPSFDSKELFYDSSKGRIYELQFLAGNQFNLKIKSPPHSISECSGKWTIDPEGLMILTCAEVPVENQLSSTYMFKRVWEVEILSKNRLRSDQVILRKK